MPGGGGFGAERLDGEVAARRAALHGGGGRGASKWSRARGKRPRGQLGWPGGETGGGAAKPGADLPSLAPAAYGAMREREWKERDRDRGIFVIRPKFKLQFSKLHFSPSSWPQMENF